MPFASCMSIPQEMSLQTINSELLLCAQPISEISTLYAHTDTAENVTVSKGQPFRKQVKDGAYDIFLKVQLSDHAEWSLSILGFTLEISTDKGLITCMGCTAPVDCTGNVMELRIILDTIYAEVFVNQGNPFMGISYIQDRNLNYVSILSHRNNILIDNPLLSSLKSFWQCKPPV